MYMYMQKHKTKADPSFNFLLPLLPASCIKPQVTPIRRNTVIALPVK